MDPLFLVTLMQQMQQRNLIAAQGRQAAREAEILNQRREKLATARQYANQLVHESSNFPQPTFVRLQLFLKNLEYYGIVPDSFDDQQEKEDAVLLWRKLASLLEKCSSFLTADQLAQCQVCLDAMVMESFINTVANRLKAYEEYRQLKPKWKSTWRKARVVAVSQKIWLVFMIIVASGFAALIVYKAYIGQIGSNAAAIALTIWILAISALGIKVYWVLESDNPEGLIAIDQRYHQLSAAAQVEDQDFWQAVTDKFDGIPTVAQLQQYWDEQEAKIRLVFGEPQSEPEPQ
jgi:hypothetical protein